jgi:uncharacterized membrane protein YgdD (TMEM256/DUF423 family)
MKAQWIVSLAALLGLTAVILGALGAHALENSLSVDQLDSFKTGVRYQAWHALAMLALFLLPATWPYKKVIAVLWAIGCVLFSISIYFLSCREILNLNLSWLGPLTPLGGLFLIAGWLMLFISSLKKHN